MSYQFANNQISRSATSSFGLSANAAALITYLFVPVTSIAVLATEKENPLVRFHAWQSIFYGLGISAMTIVLSIVITIVSFVLSSISPVAGVLVTVVSLLIWLLLVVVIVALWALCLFKAYKGEMYKLPFFGRFAERMINK